MVMEIGTVEEPLDEPLDVPLVDPLDDPVLLPVEPLEPPPGVVVAGVPV